MVSQKDIRRAVRGSPTIKYPDYSDHVPRARPRPRLHEYARCPVCHTYFQTTPKRRTYCSDECKSKRFTHDLNMECTVCHTRFHSPNPTESGLGVCSAKCNLSQYVNYTCKNCHTIYLVKGVPVPPFDEFCSRACHDTHYPDHGNNDPDPEVSIMSRLGSSLRGPE